MKEGCDDLSRGLHLGGRAGGVQVAPRSTEEGETPGGRTRRGGILCSPAPTVPVFLVRAGLPHALRELPGWVVGENRTLQQQGTLVSLNIPPLRHQETEIQRRSMSHIAVGVRTIQNSVS